MRYASLLLLWLALIAAAPAEQSLLAAIDAIRGAALSRDTKAISPLFADDLAWISQSGKLYGKAEALSDLGGGFNSWENSEIRIDRNGASAVVTLINARQRLGLEPARFRVLQIWRKGRQGWQLFAQSSTKIAN